MKSFFINMVLIIASIVAISLWDLFIAKIVLLMCLGLGCSTLNKLAPFYKNTF